MDFGDTMLQATDAIYKTQKTKISINKELSQTVNIHLSYFFKLRGFIITNQREQGHKRPNN